MSRLPVGRALRAILFGAALAMGCGSDDGSKTFMASEGHDGTAHGQTAVPGGGKTAAAAPKGYAGPTR